MTDLATIRKDLISTSMAEIRAIISEKGVNRDALEGVKNILVSMTKQKDLFCHAEFPSPTPEEYGKIYLVSEDEGETFSLYLVSTRSERRSPVHNHATWAVIAGLEGAEENTIYKRLDNGSVEGQATVEEDYRVVLRDGDGVAFMPEDIHQVQAVSKEPTRHFHLYGKSFDQQTERITFDLENGTTIAFKPGKLPIDRSRLVV